MNTERNVIIHDIKESDIVNIKISGAGLKRLKYLLDDYMSKESNEKQLAAFMFMSGILEAKANEQSNSEKTKELIKKYEQDIFVHNVFTLSTFIGAIETAFVNQGKTIEKEQEVKFRSEDLAKFYDSFNEKKD